MIQGLVQTLLVRLPLAYYMSIQPDASLTKIGLAAPVLAKYIDKIVQNEYNNSTKKGSGDMSITATELKNNLGKYLLLSAKEDIFITKNGKIVAKLTNPHQDRVEVAKSLFGILPKDADLNEAKEERLGAK